MDGTIKPTALDLRTLQLILEDCSRECPLLVNLTAGLALGFCNRFSGKREEAAIVYRRVLEVDENCKEDDERRAPPMTPNQMSEILLSEVAKDNLKGLEEGRAIKVYKSSEDILADELHEYELKLVLGPYGTDEDVQELVKRCRVGGGKCDQCGRKKGDRFILDTGKESKVKLMAYGRCKMVYYCSRDCALAGWKSIHKQACRMPRQIEVGDLVKVTAISAIMQVIEKDDGDTWLLGVIKGNHDSGVTVRSESIEPIRPKTALSE